MGDKIDAGTLHWFDDLGIVYTLGPARRHYQMAKF